jgi:hypothetical protein
MRQLRHRHLLRVRVRQYSRQILMQLHPLLIRAVQMLAEVI